MVTEPCQHQQQDVESKVGGTEWEESGSEIESDEDVEKKKRKRERWKKLLLFFYHLHLYLIVGMMSSFTKYLILVKMQ